MELLTQWRAPLDSERATAELCEAATRCLDMNIKTENLTNLDNCDAYKALNLHL